MSKVVKILAQEHTDLFNAIEAGERVRQIKDDTLFKKEVLRLISLLDIFTNEFHHPKEEDVLYAFLLKKKDTLSNRILKEISKDHHSLHLALDLVKERSLSPKRVALENAFSKYLKLLHKHIWRENIIVFINIPYFVNKEEEQKIYLLFEEIDKKGITKKKIKSELTLNTKRINKKFK
ncbi:MAG: hemerythrin domain-containing protein [Bacteroidia bacterium]|nr:hemerythrin domain-containing protein [Bacteroidia bacterium]